MLYLAAPFPAKLVSSHRLGRSPIKTTVKSLGTLRGAATSARSRDRGGPPRCEGQRCPTGERPDRTVLWGQMCGAVRGVSNCLFDWCDVARRVAEGGRIHSNL